MAKKVYPISENYVSDWTVMNALRELVANALDAEKELNAPASLSYTSKEKALVIKNQGCQLDHTALYLGESSKRGSQGYIGQYGEGLKLAFLVLARAGLDVTVVNGSEETWSPTLERDAHGVKCLVIDIKKASRQRKDVEIKVRGIEEETYYQLKSLFLAFSKEKPTYVTESGDVFDDFDLQGNIYVKGVFVKKRAELSFGYNFKDLDIGRDRKTPDDYCLNDQIAIAWADLLGRNDNKINETFVKAIHSDSAELGAFRYSGSDTITNVLVAAFVKDHGEGAIPVLTTEQVESAKSIGRKAVVVSSAHLSLLCKRLKTLDAVKRERKYSVTKTYTLDELTETERKTYSYAMKTLERIGTETLDVVSVVDFEDASVRGVYKNGLVSVARDRLNSYSQALTTLIHEFAHKYGDDGTHSHHEAIVEIMSRVLTLYGQTLEKGEGKKV